eukprot:935076-Prorocentrum_minimum.AAC.1
MPACALALEESFARARHGRRRLDTVMTQLGKVAPPNIESRISLLDRAVLVLRNPEDRHIEPVNRAKRIAIRSSVALLFPTAS